MRSMVEGSFLLKDSPPPHLVRSPSPGNPEEDKINYQMWTRCSGGR